MGNACRISWFKFSIFLLDRLFTKQVAITSSNNPLIIIFYFSYPTFLSRNHNFVILLYFLSYFPIFHIFAHLSFALPYSHHYLFSPALKNTWEYSFDTNIIVHTYINFVEGWRGRFFWIWHSGFLDENVEMKNYCVNPDTLRSWINSPLLISFRKIFLNLLHFY